MTGEDFGRRLRTLRQGKGMTQARMAAQSGVAIRSVTYWEKGQHLPGSQELEGVAQALGLTAEERQALIALLPVSKAVKIARALPTWSAVSPPPGAGDLIRALRWRRRLSRDTLAQALGVHRTTLTRWESSRAVPDAESRQRLCDALGAFPAERDALLTASHSTILWGKAAPTLDVYREEAARLAQGSGRETIPLFDLRAHLLAGTLWHLAAHQSEARSLLAQTYAAHAVYACIRGDDSAALDYSGRSLILIKAENSLPKSTLYQALWASGHARAHRAPHSGAEQSFRQARQWLLKMRRFGAPAFLFLNTAVWALRSGLLREAQEYGRAANVLMERSNNLSIYVREGFQSFQADLLVAEGRYEAALEAGLQISGGSYHRPIMRHLFQTSVFLKMGARSDADNSLRRAYALIEADQADLYRKEADGFAAQLERKA